MFTVMHLSKLLIAFIALSFMMLLSCNKIRNQSTLNSETEKKIDALIEQMTLEEKAGQMTMIGIPAVCVQDGYWDPADTLVIDTAKLAEMLNTYHVGAFLGKGYYPPSKEEYYNLIAQIQDYAVNQTRLGIPVLYGTDAVHGAHYTAESTVFPHQLAVAASWKPELAEQMAEITAYELRASNTPLNFAPVVDISWQAQWGRVFETFGEDPYLTSEMGKAFVHGGQGDDISDTLKTAVCLKHFIGYGSPQYGKDRKNAMIPERYLRQYYLPPFQAAVENDAAMVMINSGLVNGIPCHINKFYITDLLKGELNYQGVTVSDWGDMQFLTDFHKTAVDNKEAVRQMLNAGLDMCMVPYDASFAQYVVELVNEREIAESRVDDAVRRILRLKFKLGLFEQPNTHYGGYIKFASSEFAEKSYQTACEAMTLLKNEGILPLSEGKKILVTGVGAHSLNYLNGPWTRSWSGMEPEYNDPEKQTVWEAISERFGEEYVLYSEGTDFDSDINTDETVRKARQADYIVVVLGERPAAERPSDINELKLPEVQRSLVKKLAETGKPVILVLLQARGRIIRDIEPLAKAVLMAYYPGNEGGRAVAAVLSGDVNPSGKLPFSYQKYAAAPMPYLHTVSDRDDNEGGYTDYDPQWPFGFGLSYTKFSYDTLYTDKKLLTADDTLVVCVDVTNTGNRAGKEVVQIYMRDEYASVEPDFERLIRFEKVLLQAKERKTLEFKITKKELAFVGQNKEWITEPGTFILMVGDRNKQLKTTTFEYKK